MGEPVARAIELDDQRGGDVRGKASGEDGRLDCLDGVLVDHLECSGQDARGDDGGDGAAGILDLIEVGEQRLDRRRERDQSHLDLAADPQRAL